MTDAPLHLSLAATPGQIFDVAAHLSAQEQGRGWRRWGMVPAAAAGPLLAGVLAGAMAVPVNPVIFGALIGTGAMMVGQYLLSRDAMRHYRRVLSGSAFFRRPSPATLAPDGLTLGARTWPWAEITAVSRLNGQTLLQFSAVDAVTILDTDLPPGLTPADLATRIAGWKA